MYFHWDSNFCIGFMKTLIRNFTHTFRRFFTAGILNLIGLSIAFASFFVIMTQIDYDWNFNKGIKDHDRVYKVIFNREEGEWLTTIPRPFGEMLMQQSPRIESGCIWGWGDKTEFQVGEHIFTHSYGRGFGNFMLPFSPQMVEGSADALKELGVAIIPESLAQQIYPGTSAVGKHIFFGRATDNQELTIGGVYKDYPINTTFDNAIFFSFNNEAWKDDWSEWSFNLYIKLNRAEDKETAITDIIQGIQKTFKQLEGIEFGQESIQLVSMDELHFSPLASPNASNRASVFLLFCVAILIIVIAAINFMNFTLAETPMRIKSINTQKILGASKASLQGSLIIESVLLCLIAAVLACGIIVISMDTGIQELVLSRLNLNEHVQLLAGMFVISLTVGVLAGLYPAYYVTSFPPALVLKGSFGLSPKGKMLRSVLVCIQFFVSFVLIIAVGIMYLQSHYINSSDYGYNKDEIIICDLDYHIKSQKNAIINELCHISGVQGVSISRFVLSSSDNYMGWGRGEGEQRMQFNCLPVDYHYLDVMGIKLTEGRNFLPTDGDVYIFNEAARKKYPWLKVDRPILPGDYPVVGFCENIRYTSFRNDDTQMPMAFFIMGKDHAGWGWENRINIRVGKGTDKIEAMKSIRKVMEKFNPGMEPNIYFMDKVLAKNYAKEMRFTRQIVLFSVIAILISLIGVFGLTMFESEYRRKEIGLRKIMGSSTNSILYMFNRRYLLILTGCFIIAAPFGWWVGKHWLENFSVKTAISPWIFIVSFLLVSLITMLTVTYQSWKNAHENPVNSIKTE